MRYSKKLYCLNSDIPEIDKNFGQTFRKLIITEDFKSQNPRWSNRFPSVDGYEYVLFCARAFGDGNPSQQLFLIDSTYIYESL